MVWRINKLRNNEKKTIQSVDRSFEIIRCFNNNEELGVTEISRMVGIHKSTAFGLISTLVANSILEKNENTGKYRLGLELFRLGTKVNLSLKKLVLPYLEELASMFKETCNFVILRGTSVMYLEKVEGSHSMRISTLVGGEKPIHCTAVGKAIVAFLNEKDLENMIKILVLKKYTDNTITSKSAFRKSLGEIKVKGYAEDLEELENGLHCIAAPIFNQYKIPFGAISISGPVSRMTAEVCNEMGTILIKMTKEISREIGYL